jgi:hypothetical protein
MYEIFVNFFEKLINSLISVKLAQVLCIPTHLKLRACSFKNLKISQTPSNHTSSSQMCELTMQMIYIHTYICI